MVDKNEHLSTLDKFHYLKASLTGDAAAMLTGLPATSRCHTDAMQLLKQRFGNEELLMQEHMNKLIDIQPVRASDDVRGLRRLYDTVSAHIMGLETLGRKLGTFACMWLPILQRAIPGDILLDFSRKGVVETGSPTSEPQPNSDGSSPTMDAEEKGTACTFSRLLSFLRVEVESRENLAALQSMHGRETAYEAQHQRRLQIARKRPTKTCSISCSATPKCNSKMVFLL